MRGFARVAALAAAFACLATPVTGQGFGRALPVAVSSGQVLIAESGGPTSTGAVYVYERGPDGWAVSAELAPYAAEEGGAFGISLAVDGDRMLVGSPGAAHVFERSGGAWEEVATLRPAELPEGYAFGGGGAIAGDIAMVSAPGRAGRGGARVAGRVYFFEWDGSAWNEAGSVESPEAAAGDGFGAAMLTDGRVAAIGAPGTADGAGAVFFFTRADDGAWTAAPEPLTAAEAGGNAGFGSVLYGEDTEDGFRLLVGAPGAGGVGIAYTFTPDGDVWRPEGRLYPPIVAGGGRSFGGNFANAFAAVDGEIWIGGSGAGAGREGRVLRYSTDPESGVEFAGALSASNPRRGRWLRRRRRPRRVTSRWSPRAARTTGWGPPTSSSGGATSGSKPPRYGATRRTTRRSTATRWAARKGCRPISTAAR